MLPLTLRVSRHQLVTFLVFDLRLVALLLLARVRTSPTQRALRLSTRLEWLVLRRFSVVLWSLGTCR